MADLIAIAYDHEATAARAEQEVEQLREELDIEPDAVAVIVRDADGGYRVQTNHHGIEAETSWGMLWVTLFGLLFFLPVFGMAAGSDLGALMGKVEKIGIERAFHMQARDLLQPGTSALFMVVEQGSPESAITALSRYGGIALHSPLSEDAESLLQDRLRRELTSI